MERIERIFSRAVAKPYRNADITHTEPPVLNDDGLVDFAPGDVENPKNWSLGRRSYVTVCAVLLVTNATFASSSPSGCFQVRRPTILSALFCW
jgi:DHA1 family multidrug resistance protein-like MFS transporter